MTGCVDGKDDFDAFVARSSSTAAGATAAGGSSAGGASAGGAAAGGSNAGGSNAGGGATGPAFPATGDYQLTILPNLASGDTDDDIFFLAKAVVTPSADGTTASLHLDLTALKLGATTKADQVGATVGGDATIATDGTFDMNLGDLTIDGAANPITVGSAILSTQTHLIGHALGSTFCVGLNGVVTAPIATTLSADADFGLFIPFASDGSVTPYDDYTVFHCP